MTYDYGTGQPAGADSSRTDEAKGAAKDAAHTAKDEAANVAASAKDSASTLASEAKIQARDVTAEAKAQAGDVLRASREEMTAQAAVQQHKAAQSLRAFSGELGTMADSSEGGMAGDLTRQLADRVSGVASWLDEREPGDLMNEVKTFARNKPGTFLAIAAGAGLLAGRLTRGIKDAPSDDAQAAGYVGGTEGLGTTGVGTTGYGTTSAYGTTPTTPTRTSAFAAGTAGAATGAAYGASSDETAVYGTGALAGGGTQSNESSHWDDAVASTSTSTGYGTADGNPLAGVESGSQSTWSDTASAPGYGTDHIEETTTMSTTPERADNPGAYGGGAENVPVENETYGNEEGGALGGGSSEVPEHQTHQVWSPVHEQNREEDPR